MTDTAHLSFLSFKSQHILNILTTMLMLQTATQALHVFWL